MAFSFNTPPATTGSSTGGLSFGNPSGTSAFGGGTSTGTGGTGTGGFSFGGAAPPATTAASTSGTTTAFGGGTGGFSFGGGTAPSATTATTATTGGSTGGFGGFQMQQQQQQQQQQVAGSDVLQKAHFIMEAYNPESSVCRSVFRHELKYVVLGPNGAPMEPLQFAKQEICGYKQLHERIQMQKEQLKIMVTVLERVEGRIYKHQNDLDTLEQREMAQIKQRHMEQASRIMKLMSKLEVLMAQESGPLSSNDIALRNKFLALQRELHKPNQYRGRLNELIPQLNYYLQHSGQTMATQQSMALMNDENIQLVNDLLEQQTMGLERLVKIVKQDDDDKRWLIGKLREIHASQQQRRYMPRDRF